MEITYNDSKFLLDGNEIVNPEVLLPPLEEGPMGSFYVAPSFPLPATLRAEVEYRDDPHYPELLKKAVRLVEVESKPVPEKGAGDDYPIMPQPEKQAIDERVCSTCKQYKDALKSIYHKDIDLQHFVEATKIYMSSQPPPQAESQEDVAVRFAMYVSGKCTVGDQEFFRGMFRNGHWRKHEINT